jgi:hypothetical protein
MFSTSTLAGITREQRAQLQHVVQQFVQLQRMQQLYVQLRQCFLTTLA